MLYCMYKKQQKEKVIRTDVKKKKNRGRKERKKEQKVPSEASDGK